MRAGRARAIKVWPRCLVTLTMRMVCENTAISMGMDKRFRVEDVDLTCGYIVSTSHVLILFHIKKCCMCSLCVL